MPRISLWKNNRDKDYYYHDRLVGEHFYQGGTGVYVHKYAGPRDDGGNGDPVSEMTIQDVLFLENRDRNYEDDVYELRGVYNPQDNDFDLTQFGLFISNDILYITFHLNDMVDKLGRKIMSGDVLELPHLREIFFLDENTPAVNKFYVVEEATKASEGYGPTWWPHIWRVKMKPITDSGEFSDILDNPVTDWQGNAINVDSNGDGTPDTIGGIMSTYDVELGINDSILEEAEANVRWDPKQFQTSHLYVYTDEDCRPHLHMWSGDGIPPNGFQLYGIDDVALELTGDSGELTSAVFNLVPSGTSFPGNPSEGDYFLRNDFVPDRLHQYELGEWVGIGFGDEFPDDAILGDYFLRTDYEPDRLFQKEENLWRRVEDDNRAEWTSTNKLLDKFIYDDSTNCIWDPITECEETKLQPLSQVVKPKADDC